MSAILKLESVGKSYEDGENKIDVLKSVSLTMKKGDFFSIQGPSGSGKSTLLNVIGALTLPDTGELSLNGKTISSYYKSGLIHEYRLKHIGFVFQNHHLMPDFTILENVMMPLLISKISQKEAKERALAILDKVGMVERAGHHPSQVSGGESQRAGVARAVITRPSIILADEPTGNLDQKNSEKFIKLLLDLREHEGLTVLVVTHDRALAGAASKRFTLTDGSLSK
ncbi:MAG: ABC transporter ATP-binding protein [Leptospirales bacterium]